MDHGALAACIAHHTLIVTAVDNKDDGLCVLVIKAPERARVLGAAKVPQREDHFFVFNALNVETNCRNDLRVIQLAVF